MCLEMQRSGNSSSRSSGRNSVTEFQQLRGRWKTLLNRIYEDPNVAMLMNTSMGQYLSSHPLLALTVLMFSTMAALPVGLFLTFALVTIVMSAAGFLLFEMFLLFVGGLALLGVLSGVALFSVVVSFTFNGFYFTISNVLNLYHPHLTKKSEVQGKERECEPSKLKEMQ